MIQETQNYDQFSTVMSNREVDMKHVKRLAKSITKKNLLRLNPIIVNEKFDIIDGQHRLEAARALNLPVYYIIDAGVHKDDISSLNTNTKSWNLMDYINFYTVEKTPGFDVISKFLSEFSFIHPSAAVQMMSGAASSGSVSGSIRQGKVDVTNEKMARDLAKLIQRLGNYSTLAFETKFISAVIIVSNHELFDAERLFSQVEKQPRSLVRCPTKQEYVKMLLEIYNYQMHDKNRIKL